MIGQTVSHYKILEKLGEGGMGVVYKAEDTKLKRSVALKFLPKELTRDQVAKERFQREAQAAAALNHPNIITIYEIDEHEDQTYIAMECVDGQTLKEIILDVGARRAVPSGVGYKDLDEIIDIAAQICAGLAKAHKAGIIHRDIKSHNIIIDKDGRVKILDFGLAKLKGVSPLTKDSTTLGTVHYMSPEQTQGADVDHRSDIWSLGVVLYEMLTGQLPFKGEYAQAVVYSIINEEPEPLTSLRTGIPMELERIVNKALARDPSERYQHADDMVVDLRKLKKDSKPSMSVPGKTSGEIEKTQRKKIVVFPFENLGPPEDKYFADGITEEITSRLAAVSGLGVISRTSAVHYDRKGKTLTQIGADLGVDYVLEGSVRWDRGSGEKGRVRVTPQLIRVSNDTNLWSQRYDHVIEDIFMVQSEIAKNVIHHLNITLLKPEQQTLESRPTKNIEAYNAYLRGFEYMSRPGYEKEPWEMAVQMFKRAVQLDPGFTLAYVWLSKAHSEFYQQGYDRTKERILQAKAAVDIAIRLQPDLPEVHWALGYYHYYCHKAYKQALEEFTIARKRLANDTSILVPIAYIQRRQGRFHEAISNLKSAVELSPQYAHFISELGYTYLTSRKYSKAEFQLERSISLAPDVIVFYLFKALNYWAWKGDLRKARITLESMPQMDEAKSLYFWYLQEGLERNYPAALARLSSSSLEIINFHQMYITKSQMAGFLYQYMKKPELARDSFDSARILLEKELKKQPDDPRIHSSLGIVYAALGHKEEGVREGERAVELHPVSQDAFAGPHRVEDLAHIYVILGEYDIAVEKLDYLLSIPYWVSIPYLQLEPKWDPLRSQPKFQKLLEKYSQDKEEKEDNI